MMKKVISFAMIGLVFLTFSSVVTAEETVFPLRDHPDFETYVGTDDFADWREEMLENRPAECPGDGSGANSLEGHPGQGLGDGQGYKNGRQAGSGNGYGRGMNNDL